MGPLRGGEGAREIATPPAIGREHHEDVAIVRALARRLLHELVRLLVLAACVVEAREQIDQLDRVVLLLDSRLDGLHRLVPAFLLVVEPRELRVAPGPLLGARHLEGLAIGLFRFVAPVAIHREEERVGGVGTKARIGGHQLLQDRLGRGAVAAAVEEVGVEGEGRCEVLALGFDLGGRLVGLEGLLGLLERLERTRLQQVGRHPRRVHLEHGLCLGERLLRLAGAQRNASEVQARVEVRGIETHGLAQLPEALARLLVPEVGEREAVVRRRLVRVDLQHALVLDDGLRVLLLLEIRVAAGHVLFELRLVD